MWEGPQGRDRRACAARNPKGEYSLGIGSPRSNESKLQSPKSRVRLLWSRMLLIQGLRFIPQLGALAMLLTPPHPHLAVPPAWQTVVLVQGSVGAAESQEPVPGGTVTLTRGGESKPWNARLQDGHFAIEVPAGEGYRINLWAPGFHRFRSRDLTVYDGMPPLDIRLRRMLQLEGQVVDRHGNPVQGANISLFSDGEPQGSVMTTPDGRFRMVPTLPEGIHEIRVTHLLFDDAEAFEIGYPPEAHVEIVLYPRGRDQAGWILGVVKGPGSQILPDVVIRLSAGASGPFQGTSRSDQNGRYSFDSLEPGPYALRFSHQAYSNSTGHSREVAVGPGEAVTVNFQFQGSESLAGVVIDDRSEALAGALVMLQTMAESTARASDPTLVHGFYESTTDEQGMFEFRGIEPGPYELVIRTLDRKFQERRVTVRIPEDNALVLDLEPGRTLQALIFDAKGEAVTEFGLSLRATSGEGGSFAQHFELLDRPAAVSGLQSAEYVVTISLADETSYSGLVDLGRGSSVALQIPESGEHLIVHYLER